MAQIFPKWTNEVPRLSVVGLTILAFTTIFVVWYWFSPKHTDVGYQPQQPIPYSHALHAGTLQINCQYCHYNVDKSAHAGVPPTQVCMNCHQQVKKDSPLLEPLRKSWKEGTPVQWKRVHKLPDFAYFNHSAHIAIRNLGVGIGCQSCHGRIDQMEVVTQREPLSMSWCLECHNNPAPNLRPIDKVTVMGWEGDVGWPTKAEKIAKQLNPPGNRNAKTYLPDGQVVVRATAGCTGCHR